MAERSKRGSAAMDTGEQHEISCGGSSDQHAERGQEGRRASHPDTDEDNNEIGQAAAGPSLAVRMAWESRSPESREPLTAIDACS